MTRSIFDLERMAFLLGFLAMAVFAATPAVAQQLYVHGGAGFPSSSGFRAAYNTGYNVGVGVGIPITSNLEGVVRGSYDRFGLDSNLNGGDFAAYSATGNVKVKTPVRNGRISPYALGGAGIFRLGTENNYDTDFGLELGAGVDIRTTRRMNLMIEPNYVLVFHEGENTQYFPVRVGASFGMRM